jgi:hypothetical protein
MISKLALLYLAISGVALAGPPGLQPITESRTTRSLTAVAMAGQTYLAERSMQVDLDFPDGEKGKGRLYVLFEPLSGFYMQAFRWLADSYPGYPEARLVGVASDRLFVASSYQGLVIEDSAEKATDVDDAEAKALK